MGMAMHASHRQHTKLISCVPEDSTHSDTHTKATENNNYIAVNSALACQLFRLAFGRRTLNSERTMRTYNIRASHVPITFSFS